MRRFFLLVLSFAFLVKSNLLAQADFEFDGYFQNFPVVQFINSQLSNLYNVDKRIQLDISRLRLKPVLYLSDNTRLNLEFETDLFAYNKLTDFFNLTDEKTNRQIVKMKWVRNEKSLSLLAFVDRLYLKHDFSWGNVILGRQRISWGTGRIWNPTDLFNPINPTSFYKIEKDGADLLSSKIFLGDFTDLNLVFNPQENFSESNYGFRFRTNFDEYDFSLSGGRFDGKSVLGADFAGNLNEAGVRGEGIYYFKNENNPQAFLKFILGIDYQFTSKFYALAEYHYNGEGKLKRQEYEFGRLFKGEILNVSKSYLAVSAMYNATPLLVLTFTNINNLVDGSSLFAFRADYSLSENSYLDFGTQLFYGEKFSEYWFYPNSVYLVYEYYF